MLEISILLSFGVGYFIRLFEMLERKSYFGPYQSYTQKIFRVYRGKEGEVERIYEQPVTLIERIRRASPLNPYSVSDDETEWHVDAEKAEVWECPKCLSPWMAFATVVPFMLVMGRWRQIPLMWVGVTGGGYFIYSLTEHFWQSAAPTFASSGEPPSDVGSI